MTKTLLDPALHLVQAISEQEITLRAVAHTDNQGEPCEHCQVSRHVNMVTLHGFDSAGERTTADCCAACIPAVATEYFHPLYGIVAEVAR
jgi:hypothetical protein